MPSKLHVISEVASEVEATSEELQELENDVQDCSSEHRIRVIGLPESTQSQDLSMVNVHSAGLNGIHADFRSTLGELKYSNRVHGTTITVADIHLLDMEIAHLRTQLEVQGTQLVGKLEALFANAVPLQAYERVLRDNGMLSMENSRLHAQLAAARGDAYSAGVHSFLSRGLGDPFGDPCGGDLGARGPTTATSRSAAAR